MIGKSRENCFRVSQMNLSREKPKWIKYHAIKIRYAFRYLENHSKQHSLNFFNETWT